MINTLVFKQAVSSIEDSIFVLDNKFNTLEESADSARHVEKDCQIVIEPSTETDIQFTDSQQETTSECRTPDIDAIKFSTVRTREAMWPI